MSIQREFSRQLLDFRTSHRLTQRQMSELCNISLRHYQNLEIGRSVPNLTTAVSIASVLNLSLDSLKNGINDLSSLDKD